MANHWAPSGLISRDFECKKSVSLCVKLVQMPLSNFTLHLPYSPDVGDPAGVKWGCASLSSIHLMRRRQKSRKRHKAAAGGQQLRTNEQIICFTVYTPTNQTVIHFLFLPLLHSKPAQKMAPGLGTKLGPYLYEANHSEQNQFNFLFINSFIYLFSNLQ